MTRSTVRHWCRDCGAESIRWQGRCPACGGWNTLEEVAVHAVASSIAPEGAREGPCPIVEVEAGAWRAVPTGIPELDRVLGGGLVRGSATLLGGEPGIGKSTLALQVAASLARRGIRVLYLSGEESSAQIRQRADRLGAVSDDLWLAAAPQMPDTLAALDAVEPAMLVVDSVQTVVDPDVGGVPGSVSQVRAVAARLVAEAKARPVTIVMVGHVTKEGSLAGPRVLEHCVDTVLHFEGDRHHALRLLRAAKHRFGAVDDLGVFEMTAGGLVGVPDPSALFLADRVPGLSGSAIVPTMDGQRPILVEIQALTDRSHLASPRRSAQGVDAGRLGFLLAVLERRAGMAVHDQDVYALAVGGARVAEPGADLAVVLAVASARSDVALDPDVVVCAEVGLAGELRRVAHIERRLAEAARLGFREALVPAGTPAPDGLRVVPLRSLAEAIDHIGIERSVSRSGEHPWGADMAVLHGSPHADRVASAVHPAGSAGRVVPFPSATGPEAPA
jgi:DNA repair protein RadA/Sms